MRIERERRMFVYMDTDSEKEISIGGESDNFHSFRSRPVALKTAQPRRETNLRVACGKPETTEILVM
jgi:hypothetical protein